jgi:hypothetical protein
MRLDLLTYLGNSSISLLLLFINMIKIEVSEDGENGCVINYNLTRPAQSIVI